MPEIVDDTQNEFMDNIKPGIAGAAGYGLGSAFLGPGLGLAAGGTVAGAYVGGTPGTVLTVTGMSLGLLTLLFGSPFGGGGTARSTSGGGAQGIK